MSTKTLVTVEQFAQMPPDERVRFELVEGELVAVPSGTPIHAWIRDELGGAIRAHLRDNRGGVAIAEVDCRTGTDTVRRPDIAVFSTDRWRLIDPEALPVPFPPDIAIEILSPGETAMNVNRKVVEYLTAGSSEVWVVDSRNHEVYIRTAEGIRVLKVGEVIESPLLPGFALLVGDVFARP
jgi:Uma2 family endonuclease